MKSNLRSSTITLSAIFSLLSFSSAYAGLESLDVENLERSALSVTEVSTELRTELDALNAAAGCPKCPILFGAAEGGIAYTRARNIGTDQSRPNAGMPSFSIAGTGGIEFGRFSIGPTVGAELSPIIAPFYVYAGGQIEAVLGKQGGMYLQGKIYRVHYVLKTYDANGDPAWDAPPATLVGGQIGFGRRREGRFGATFMRDLKGNWTQVGLRFEFERVSPSRKRR